MFEIALEFFDQLLFAIFKDSIKDKIKDFLSRRHVERTISRSAEAPAQALDSYFRNENIEKNKVEMILNEVQRAINSAEITAKLLASASLNPEKLREMILSKYPVPQNIKEEQLEWPFQMSLQIAADVLCNVGPRFAEWEKEAWRKNFEAFDKLLENQERIIEAVGPGGQGTLDERFEHTYRSHVLRRLAQIDASTLRVSSSLFLDLTTVFVQPDVVKVPKSKKKRKRKGRRTEKRTRTEETAIVDKVVSLEEARQLILSQDEGEKSSPRVPAEDWITKGKRCAIVGLPGSGKTTLLQHILLTAARGELSFGQKNGIVPIFVRARQLDPGNLPGGEDLLTVTEGKVIGRARPGFLSRQLDVGKILLLIDGLDEIMVEKREDVIKWISDFVRMYPNCRYIVSSRPAGYQSETLLDLGFTEARLSEFSQNQVREYVHRWTKAVKLSEGASGEEAETSATRYAATLVERTEKNPYVRRIATNPLLLSTLCLVQRYEGGDLPNRRVVLYERCVEGLLFHWDNKRGLPPAILGRLPLERKVMLLRRLAVEMQVKGVAEFEEEAVEASFGVSLAEVGEKADAGLIMENIRDRSGLLVERRPGVYGFSHLTFQEYLAALAVSQGDFKAYDRLFIFSKRSDPQWAEVIALFAGLTSKNSVERILKELISTKNRNSVLLAGQCLSTAADVGLDTQKVVISALLTLSDEFKLDKPPWFAVHMILDSLDEGIVLEMTTTPELKLGSVHAMRYVYFTRSPEAIPALLTAGSKVLSGKQEYTVLDRYISSILLLIQHPDAAAALGKLVNIAEGVNNLEGCARLALGLFNFEVWEDYQKADVVLPGVLAFLNTEDLADEQVHICKFIAWASSKRITDQILKTQEKDDVGYIFHRGHENRGLPHLLSILDNLGQYGHVTFKEYAQRAAVNLEKAINRLWSEKH